MISIGYWIQSIFFSLHNTKLFKKRSLFWKNNHLNSENKYPTNPPGNSDINQRAKIKLTMAYDWCNFVYNVIQFNMKTSTKVLSWTARILCILAILFISIFALDSFSSERTFWQNATAFLMHLIPSFVMLAILIIAWKWENIGGIILTIIGLALSIFVFVINFKRNHFPVAVSLRNAFMVTFPFILAGILFILSYFKKKKELSSFQ